MAAESLPNVIRFPRGKKRGAKVRHGPCADLIDLPGSARHGEELMPEWDWLFQAFGNWHREDPRVPAGGKAPRTGTANRKSPVEGSVPSAGLPNEDARASVFANASCIERN